MRTFLFVLLSLSLIQCSVNNDHALNEAKAAEKILTYERRLAKLPLNIGSSMRGLSIYKELGLDKDSLQSDMALRSYVRFQLKLIDTLNSRLYRNPNLEEISMAACCKGNASEQTRLYIDSISHSALIIAEHEGGPSIDRDVNVLRSYFFDHLSASTKDYFTQFEKELVEGFSEDGGLAISVHDLADRLAFWDKFCFRYPDHVLIHDAKDRRDTYLYYFLVGVDYNPTFDNESHKFTKEFNDAYNYYLKTFPSTQSSRVIRNYLTLIEQSAYSDNEKIIAFARQYYIY
jgi:hypothetical protein